MRFAIRVKPGAKRDAVGGEFNGALVVAVRAPAVDGKANAAVRTVLARALGVRARDVLVVQGERGRDKLVELADPPPGTEAVLGSLLGAARETRR
jgi:uncharacterized protein (TIGR00251 family)